MTSYNSGVAIPSKNKIEVLNLIDVMLSEINGQLLLSTGSTAKNQPLTKNATQK